MRAMVFEGNKEPLVKREVSKPHPGPGQVLLKVMACGVCRTDLHILDGELAQPKLPLILGHQIVGVVEQVGDKVDPKLLGSRRGVPWLGKTCGKCHFCLSGRENLCDLAQYTGYNMDGGFADYTVADVNFTFPIPSGFSDVQAAPLLCAGLIGYRAYRMAGKGKRMGLFGFGSAASIMIQTARYEGWEVYAFTKDGDTKTQNFAKELGAVWAGGTSDNPDALMDASIIFAPAGNLVPIALKGVDKGGVVVCAGIHMSDIPSFPYSILWEERILRSVANLTRKDGEEFLNLAVEVPVKTFDRQYSLEDVNEALEDLRNGRLEGSAVIKL